MSATRPTIVDIYCRLASKKHADAFGHEEQEAICRAFCEAHGLIVGMVHHEVPSLDRERLRLMRIRYRDGIIQGVVMTHLSCLTSSLPHMAVLVGEMEARNVTLHLVEEQLDGTPHGRLTRLVLDASNGVGPDNALAPLLTTNFVQELIAEVELGKALDSLPIDFVEGV